jgi:hypothetical protein
MRTTNLLTACICTTALAACSVCGVEVRLNVDEPARVARTPAMVTTGVPFARGAVSDVTKLTVTMSGEPIPAQFVRIAPWDDGSIRWALMDVQAPVVAAGRAELVVSDAGDNPAPDSPVTVAVAADVVRVSTGALKLVIHKKRRGLFESLTVDGKPLLTGGGRGLVLYKQDGGQVVASPPEEVRVEHAGPIRATVCLRGSFHGAHKDLLRYTTRISAFAGQKFLKVHLWLENHGAMGYRGGDEGGSSKNVEWFCFDGMAVELGLGLGQKLTAACEGVQATDRLKVLQLCVQSIAQAKERRKRGPFYTWDDFAYTITGNGNELKNGDRTDAVVAIKGSLGSLTAAIRDFWQNYEKAIELDGRTLKLWLWPTEGQWPRARGNLHSGSMFDKDLQAIAKEGRYLLPGAVHKGHEFILDFSDRDPTQSAAEQSAPLRALASAEYYAATRAAPGLFAPPGVRTGDRECDFKLAAWTRMTRSAADPQSPTGLRMARRHSSESRVGYFTDSLYWYGWMDFGDIAVPGRGPVCLHYDWPWILLINALRTGDPDSMSLATEMVRHRADVDQLWSDRDPPQCRGLQRGEFNFPSFHCYRLYRPPTVTSNWLAGVVLYYMLTGEPKALECCRRNAESLKTAWRWVARTKPWAGPQTDMAANGRSIFAFCAMYDLTADRKWLDEALTLFNTNVIAKWKAHGPFLHDPKRQIRSQSYIKDDQRYCYSIQAFCELHHRTANETVMKLLVEGCQKEFPESFYDAPLFLSGLFAYVGRKTGNREYLQRAAELFAAGFPESRNPPVHLPDNSTWSRQSALMLRSGHLPQYGHWRRENGE